MQYPDWLNQYRKPKTEIRFIKGQYYLYSIAYKYSKEKKKTKKITGQLLGKISQSEGFVRSKKDILRDLPESKIHIAEFGAGNLFVTHMQKELTFLESSFAQSGIEWKKIAAAAMMRWIYKSPIKMMDFHWQNSFFRTQWNVSLSDKQISVLLRELGERRELILDYFGNFPATGEHLLIDTTTIPSKSELMDNVTPGYGHDMHFSLQSNLFFIFSTKLQMPIYYRVVPGNIRDVKSFAISLEESGVDDAVIIADKGFYSKANIDLLKQVKLSYIIPLRRSSLLVDYTPLEKGSRKEMSGYFEFDGRFIWYYDTKAEDERIVLFFDEKLKLQEEQDYLRRIATHPEEYNKENFFQKQFQFGTLACITNLEDTAEKIYQLYKSRGQIEQVFDAYKNFLEADRTYMQNDKALLGWSFINFLAIQAYYKLYQVLKKKDKLKKFSLEDIVHYGIKKKKLLINDKWIDAELTKKHSLILDLASPTTL